MSKRVINGVKYQITKKYSASYREQILAAKDEDEATTILLEAAKAKVPAGTMAKLRKAVEGRRQTLAAERLKKASSLILPPGSGSVLVRP